NSSVRGFCLAELLLCRHEIVSRLLSEFEAVLLPSGAINSGTTFRDAVRAFHVLQDAGSQQEELTQAFSSLKSDFVVAARNETKYSQRNPALLREMATLAQKFEVSDGECLRLKAEVARLENAQAHLKDKFAREQQKVAA